MKNREILLLLLVAALVLSAGMFLAAEVKEIMGAGATFPYPLYSKWFDIYHNETGIKVNYQGIGSGGGIRQLQAKTVDFGGTDAFLSDEDLAEHASNPILHVPTCLGAIVIAYNLPGNPELKLTSDVIADIFLGKIKKWNDRRITKLNPDVNLPSLDIAVVHRSDGSGSTFCFSYYLSKVNTEWKNKVGVGKSLEWPVGLGGKGNPGVAALVKQVKGAVGYVELAYAIENDIPYAQVQNKSGKFVKPSLKSVSLAANINLPDHTRASITNTDAENGYPVSSFTWIIFYQKQNYSGRSREQAEELVKLLWWMIHGGQQYTESLLYAPLPAEAVKKAEKIIKSVSFNGKAVLE